MDRKELETLRKWFLAYAGLFSFPEEEHQSNINLKVRHTLEVCRNIVVIAREEGLPPEDVSLAEAAALLHDVGRFPQYARWRTFHDRASTNHGKLGVRVLREEKVLERLPPGDRAILINAVRYHNALGIPAFKDPRPLLFIRLLRDADKLDIWRVMVEYYESPLPERVPAVVLDLPDEPTYSGSAVQSILSGEPVTMATLSTVNDFRLMQLSWVHDLNFRPSFRLLLEKGYIERIAAFLPEDAEIAGAVRRVRKFAESRAL